MQTAPVSPREPPTTSTSPESNLVEFGRRPGAVARTPSPITPPAGAPGAPGGMPISATRSSPVCDLPGAIQCPSFAAWKLTVMSASTAAPSATPLEASTPEAMSAATIGASHPLIASIATSAGALGAPSNPVPKIASTTTPAPSIAAAT